MINIKKITSILLINILFVSGCSSAFTVNKLAKNLNNYCIEAEYFDNTKTIEAKQTLTYTNKTGTTLNELKFNLYPKAFKEGASNKPVGSLTQQKAYPNGKDYGDIDIMSVTTSNKDQEYSYEEIDNNILNVKLNKPLKKGKIVNIDMEYSIDHRFGYGNNAYKIGWLDEGLTEYTTALFYELNPEYNIKIEDVINNALTAYTMFVDVSSKSSEQWTQRSTEP